MDFARVVYEMLTSDAEGRAARTFALPLSARMRLSREPLSVEKGNFECDQSMKAVLRSVSFMRVLGSLSSLLRGTEALRRSSNCFSTRERVSFTNMVTRELRTLTMMCERSL